VTGGIWTLATPTAVAGTTYIARHIDLPGGCGASNPSSTVTALAPRTATCGSITGPNP
jgi:hypothetical protein